MSESVLYNQRFLVGAIYLQAIESGDLLKARAIRLHAAGDAATIAELKLVWSDLKEERLENEKTRDSSRA